MKSFTTTTTKI